MICNKGKENEDENQVETVFKALWFSNIAAWNTIDYLIWHHIHLSNKMASGEKKENKKFTNDTTESLRNCSITGKDCYAVSG